MHWSHKQKNAFNEHLPDLSSIDITKEKENNLTRLVFSTYPSIMNKIDKEKVDKGKILWNWPF